MRQKLQIAPQKSLVMTYQMQQALRILQMPQIELAEFLRDEIDKNPLLVEIPASKAPTFEKEIPAYSSVYDSIESQIHDTFLNTHERGIALKLLSQLDEKGFLCTPLEEMNEPVAKLEEILEILQGLNPPGIFARSLQESLLLQLRAKGKENTKAYTIIENNYPDLLHGRYKHLQKICSSSEITTAIEILSNLQIRPLESFKQETTHPISPDIFIRKTENGWSIGVFDDELPKFFVSGEYESIPDASDEEKKMLQIWQSQGKGLLSALTKRKEILAKICVKIVKRQSAYLALSGPLLPLTIRELSEDLGLHESTLSRALAGKYAETPGGLLPIKSLITTTPEKKDAKEALQEIIKNEQCPFSDEELAVELKKRGLTVARRTISKYRKELKIVSAKYRKHLKKNAFS